MECQPANDNSPTKQENIQAVLALSEKTLALIAERSGIEAPLTIVERTTKGHIGDNLIVSSDQDLYFLKGSKNRNPERAKQIHDVEDFMREKGIPAVSALGPPGAKDTFEQDRRWSLYPYVDGKHFESTSFTPKALVSAGDMLAQIHEKSIGNEPPFDMPFALDPIDPERFRIEAENLIASINSKQPQDDFDRAVLASFELKFSLAEHFAAPTDFGEFPSAINHGDYQHENLFFDDDDNVAWLIDWELSTWRPRIAEVTRTVLYMCFDSRFTEDGFERSKHFLSAYHRRQPFLKEELQAGFRHHLQRQLTATWIPKIHYGGNSRVDEFLPKETESIRYLSEHLDEMVERLYSEIEGK